MAKLVRPLGTIDRRLHKAEIQELALENAEAIVKTGKYDLLKVYVELKRYESYLKGLILHLKDFALADAQKKGQRTFEYDQAKVRITQRTSWDYSVDMQWKELDKEIQELRNKQKAREKILKENQNAVEFVDPETGELIEDLNLPQLTKFGLSITL